MKRKAKILLQNNSQYEGYFFGSTKGISGEFVFNTGMVGYTEALTDPSYKGQVLVLTYPLIGNYGVPEDQQSQEIPQDFESKEIQIAGLIVNNYSPEYSHFKAGRSLGRWLKDQGVPGVYNVDTRALTKELRTSGTMPGKITVRDEEVDFCNPNQLNLVDKVSVKKPVIYNQKGDKTVLLFDCGVKLSIIRSLVKRNVRVLRVPYNHNVSEVEQDFDGVLISNGPGDPKKCKPTIESLKKLLKTKIPMLGICLGNQLLALAAGGDTYKLKFGHRGQNQPCVETGTKKCYITSQNHGYAVKPRLPDNWEVWFTNLNDQTIEGIRHQTNPFFSTQFHPEANPGPTDTKFIFDNFVGIL